MMAAGLTVFFVWTAKPILSADYDLYVDANHKDEENGTKEKPFKTIKKAINELEDKGGAIYIKNGEYNESLVLGEKIELYGESVSGVVIKQGIAVEENSVIKDLTINGGSNAISIEGGVSAKIDNCRIKNFSKIGINASAGGGKIRIENSSIYDGGTKGMYIQKGREIELDGNRVYDNAEEGIDLREEVSGVIKNNEIYNNGESGIELVVGGADLLIEDNQIRKNGSSGIAVQFYRESDSLGTIKIEDNLLSRNEKYGLDCNRPSGGNPKSNYWNKALELSENVIEKNEIRSINEYCKIIRAVDDQEENTNIKIEQTEEEKLLKDDAQDTETGKTPEEAEMQELRLEEEKIRLQQQQVEEADAITLELSEAEERSALLMDELNKENKLLVFIVGYNEKMLKLINQEIIENGDRINRLKKIFLETENKEFKETLSETIDKFNEIRQKEKIFLEKKKGAFNLKNLWEDFVFLFKK
jgi:hypothetical protein